MRIGVPKEIKDHEYRVGLTPAGARALVAAGHRVVVEAGAGAAIGFSDALYRETGATVEEGPEAPWGCDLVVKVKEPQPSEFPFLRPDLVLFTYLHLAPDPVQARALVESGCTAIAYETVTGPGGLPLLLPMSEVAGRISIQAGAHALQMANGGRGVLLGGVPGVAPARVVVIGGGVVGTEAARMALGLGADVTLLDVDLERLRRLDALFGPALKTRYSEPHAIEELTREADLVVGAVLLPGHAAPRLVSREMVAAMPRGAAIVDVAIDQGGCVETSRPTSHSDPLFIEEGVVHYCVTNMPGACARSATLALTNATLPYLLKLATLGWRRALAEDGGLRDGLNVCAGRITHEAVAHDLGWDYTPATEMLGP